MAVGATKWSKYIKDRYPAGFRQAQTRGSASATVLFRRLTARSGEGGPAQRYARPLVARGCATELLNRERGTCAALRLEALDLELLQPARLRIRAATPADASLLHWLWTDPRVMTQVGFPNGLDIDRDEIEASIRAREPSLFTQYLIVEVAETGVPIGECKWRPHPT